MASSMPPSCPLSIWQHPFVQNVLPFLSSLLLHVTILLAAFLIIPKAVEGLKRAMRQEQVMVPTADVTDGPDGGIPHPGLEGDANRAAAQDKFPNVSADAQGIAEKPSQDLTTALGGGSGDTVSDPVIGVGANIGPMGMGSGLGSGVGERNGGGAGDGSGPLARFGVRGGGGGIGRANNFLGVPGGRANRIVFVLDATGSMLSEFDNLRVQLRKSIDDLRPPQSFNVVFIKENSPPPPAPELLFTTPENKRLVLDYVEKFSATGPTDPIPALTRAFAMKPELIYLLCDPSDFPDRKAVLDLIHKANPDGKIKINCIGFEVHDAASSKYLDEISKQTGGMHKDVTSKDLLDGQ